MLASYNANRRRELDIMVYQKIFKRYEYKYLLTYQQKEELLRYMQDYMKPDEYGRSTLCNLYFDTSDYLLIRRSIENKVYKEKLRLRTYGRASSNQDAFIELKKKYQKVVYKRRIYTDYQKAFAYLNQKDDLDFHNQVTSEIEYVLSFYPHLRPSVYLSYEREAFYGKDDHELRMTFDQNILWRNQDLDLRSEIYGRPLLKDNQVLMEIKVGHGIPLWLTRFLTENKIYRTSFSKYGLAYQTMVKEGELKNYESVI